MYFLMGMSLLFLFFYLLSKYLKVKEPESVSGIETDSEPETDPEPIYDDILDAMNAVHLEDVAEDLEDVAEDFDAEDLEDVDVHEDLEDVAVPEVRPSVIDRAYLLEKKIETHIHYVNQLLDTDCQSLSDIYNFLRELYQE